MLQGNESLGMELLKTVGVPLAQVLVILIVLKRYVIPDSTEQIKELFATMQDTLTAQQEAAFKANEQHQDEKRTAHFDQLRRDLSTTIDKATENAIMRYLWEVERRRGQS